MKMIDLKDLRKYFLLELVLSLIIILGLYFCVTGGYGSDEDTMPLIGAFESMMSGGKLMASRFTPYPVAELGIGFLSYNFGSAVTNLVTFIFLIIGLVFLSYFGIRFSCKDRRLITFACERKLRLDNHFVLCRFAETMSIERRV